MYFPCLAGNRRRDGFAADCLLRQIYVTALYIVLRTTDDALRCNLSIGDCRKACNALHWRRWGVREIDMTATAERMRMMRERRRERGLRELRLVVPDPKLASVRKRVAAQLGRLDQRHEDEALNWIEAVSEFDALNLRGR